MKAALLSASLLGITGLITELHLSAAGIMLLKIPLIKQLRQHAAMEGIMTATAALTALMQTVLHAPQGQRETAQTSSEYALAQMKPAMQPGSGRAAIILLFLIMKKLKPAAAIIKTMIVMVVWMLAWVVQALYGMLTMA